MVAKQQQEQQQIMEFDSIPAIRIWTWARSQLDKCDEAYHKRKKEVITITAERLKSKGFQENRICSEICKQLSDYVDDAYVREVLPSTYKSATIARNNGKQSVENHTSNAVKKHMLVEAYEIERVHTYSKEYLIEIVKYLHGNLELVKQDTHRRMEHSLTIE